MWFIYLYLIGILLLSTLTIKAFIDGDMRLGISGAIGIIGILSMNLIFLKFWKGR